MVGTLGDVVPRCDQRLELRERGMHLPGHRALLGFLPEDLSRQLTQIAALLYRDLNVLDLPLELILESLQRDCVLSVEVREAIDLRGRGRMVENPPEIDRERLIGLLVENSLIVPGSCHPG